MRRTRSENASFVIKSVEALGLRVAGGSRLTRMRDILTDAKSVVQPDDPEFETALEAERDLQVLGFVFETAAAHPADSKFHQLVRQVLSDSVLPQDNRNQSKGRDMQFELFVAAVCQKAELTPVDRQEPDVICTLNDVKFGIAAKRLKSAGSFRKRIQKAADQIAKAGFPGIVALETSLLFNQENDRITAPISDAEFWPLYGRALHHHVEPYHDKIQKWVRGKGVRGVVFHDQQLRLEPSGEWCLAGMTMTLCTAGVNQRRNREFQLFDKKYRRGLPNRVRIPL